MGSGADIVPTFREALLPEVPQDVGHHRVVQNPASVLVLAIGAVALAEVLADGARVHVEPGGEFLGRGGHEDNVAKRAD